MLDFWPGQCLRPMFHCSATTLKVMGEVGLRLTIKCILAAFPIKSITWRFSLFSILLSILVVIPFAISLFLTIGTAGWLSRLFLVYPSYPPKKMFYRSSSLLSTTHRQSSCFSKSYPSPHLPLRIIAYPFTSRLSFIRSNHYCVIPTHSSWNYHPWSFIWFWSD